MTEPLIHDAVRAGTLSMDLTPVFLGSRKQVEMAMEFISRYDRIAATS